MLALLSDPQNWLAFVTLTLLEVILGFDNIIFISILVARLPAAQQETARITGLALAMLTRVALLFSIVWLTGLVQPMFHVADRGVSGRDLILLGGGLFLLARHDWNSGLRIMRMGLFIALMFSTVMEFADQQLHAITDFAVIVTLYAIVGAAGEAERRGEIQPTARRQRNKLRRDDRAAAGAEHG